jgi:hypothetical protein
MDYKYDQFKHGARCTCIIDGIKITDAKISIDEDGSVYICQNKKIGATPQDKLGYKYSWLILYKDDDFEEEDRGITNLILKGIDVIASVLYEILYSKNPRKEERLELLRKTKEYLKEGEINLGLSIPVQREINETAGKVVAHALPNDSMIGKPGAYNYLDEDDYYEVVEEFLDKTTDKIMRKFLLNEMDKEINKLKLN